MSPAKSIKPRAAKAAAPTTPALPVAEATPPETALPVVEKTALTVPEPEMSAPVTQQPQAQAPATPPAAVDLNQADFPLHPERIWPD